MKLKETFKKQGGFKLLKQYYSNGALFTAACEFLLLGKSRTALELLRNAAELKTKQRLEKKIQHKLEGFKLVTCNKSVYNQRRKIWICWLQGIDQAPRIVQICYKSMLNNLPHKEIILVTGENFSKYVDMPEYVLNKWYQGKITDTHFTDLLRLELLTKYGGTWIDATVFCSFQEKSIPNYMFESDLFFFQQLKPGKDGHCLYPSSWFITSKPNNYILEATKYLLYDYWKNNDKLNDYFLLHYIISIVMDYQPVLVDQIIKKDNGEPHILLLSLKKGKDIKEMEYILKEIPFHKLSYKGIDFTNEQLIYLKKFFE